MGRRRSEQIIFWVTPEERELIVQKMAQLGTENMSADLRKIAIDGYVVKLNLPELREMISLLRRTTSLPALPRYSKGHIFFAGGGLRYRKSSPRFFLIFRASRIVCGILAKKDIR